MSEGLTPPSLSLGDPLEDEESLLRSELVTQPLPHTGGKGWFTEPGNCE